MRVMYACAFVGALALGREQAAVYAHGVGMADLIQVILAAAYYAVVVAAIWLISGWFKRHATGRFPTTRRLFSVVERLMRPSAKEGPDGSGHSQKPLVKLLPTLFGLSLVPSGFWLNVDILRRRGTGTLCAVIWLAPCNAISYKAWFILISLLKVVGLVWILVALSKVITVALAIAACAIVIDGARLLHLASGSWRSAIWQRLKPLWDFN